MNKKFVKVIACVSAVVMILFLVACSGSTTTQGTSSSSKTTTAPTEQKKEPVTISIFAYNLTEVGEQTDPVAKEIEKKLGIKLNVYKNASNATVDQTIGTMLASNDLADVQYLGSNAEKNINAAIKSDMIIPLNDLMAENAPNIMNTPDLKLRWDYNLKKYGVDGKNYLIALWGGTGLDTTPMAGPYFRWDLYSKLGYPSIETDDDFIKVLSDMQKLNPKTEDGKNVYALSGWFGDAAGWADWPIIHMFAWGRGIAVANINCGAVVDISKNELLPNVLTDPNSYYWNAVEFYYKAQKAGILDPDSPTQKNDKYMEKVRSGRVLVIPTGWDARVMKTDLEKAGIPDAAFISPAPRANDSGTVLGWTGYMVNGNYAISKNCKNPDKALQLLDFVSSPEGSRLMHSGVEGQAWEMKDGKPALTEQYLKDLKTLNEKALEDKYAVNKYRHFSGYQLNVLSPKDNEVFDLHQAGAYTSKAYNAAEKDAIDYYGVKTLTDIYLKDKKAFTFVGEYANFPQKPADLQTLEAAVGNYIFANVFKCIYAKNDEDFAAKKQVFIDGLAKYKIDDLYEWSVNEYNKNKQQMGSQIDPLVKEFEAKTLSDR